MLETEVVNTAKNLLEEIINQNLNTHDIVEQIRQSSNLYFNNKKKIYLCGKLPWVIRLYNELQQGVDKKQEYFIVDIEDKNAISLKRLPTLLDEDSICVICSRAYLEDYFEIISKRGNYIYYPAFLLIMGQDKKKKEKYGYHYDAVIELIDNVVKNASIYLDLLKVLVDEESKRILSAILLFRTSFDLNLTKNIKTKRIHYWDDAIYKFTSNDVIVDAGGFIGDSLASFLDGGFLCKEYYLFEPTEAIEKAKQYEKLAPFHVVYEQCGLYSHDGILSFALRKDDVGELTGVSQIDSEGETKISVARLASKVKTVPTFIKMDVEGSELEVLNGAERAVDGSTSYAICAYHKVNDIVEIYDWLKKRGNYKYYMRAEKNNLMVDFVLYAISEKES